MGSKHVTEIPKLRDKEIAQYSGVRHFEPNFSKIQSSHNKANLKNNNFLDFVRTYIYLVLIFTPILISFSILFDIPIF